jgi:hypothetical protein
MENVRNLDDRGSKGDGVPWPLDQDFSGCGNNVAVKLKRPEKDVRRR